MFQKIIENILILATSKELQKFGFVGLSCAGFTLAFTWFLTDILNLFYAYSVAISVEITIIWAFLALDKWVFKQHNKKHGLIHRLVSYNLVCLISLGLNEGILLLLSLQFGIHYLISEVIAMIFSGSLNYYLLKNAVMVSFKNNT